VSGGGFPSIAAAASRGSIAALMVWSLLVVTGPASADEAQVSKLDFVPTSGIAFSSPCRAGTIDLERGPEFEMYTGCLAGRDSDRVRLEEDFGRLLQTGIVSSGPGQTIGLCAAGVERGIDRGFLFDTAGSCLTPESEELNLITFNIRTDAAQICELTQ
jgi:hypothetical protein